MTAALHAMPFGAEVQPAGGVRFALWGPAHHHVTLRLEGPEMRAFSLRADADGWHRLHVPEARAGTRYRFGLPDDRWVPDPASRFQPDDVHGPSEVVDPRRHRWHDTAWRGRPWHEAVVYELHVGTFTAAGTFLAAIERLDHLVRLGVTAIELMPVADFPGRRNWGYDGVLPFAPDAVYGRPEDLKTLIDAAHGHGLMVLLDVVYNHFGPDGNYLSLYAPQFFNAHHQTPWGAAINYDATGSAMVREFVLHNALYWLEEFHFDGLRLDAVHALHDASSTHLLDELARRARTCISQRTVHLLLENEHNEARRLARHADGSTQLYDAQWNDDVHHVLHVAATGEREGYYADYHRTGLLARALAEGFAYQGETMPYRGAARGEPSAALPPTAFVAFIQNHDQIGNRAFGERLSILTDAAALHALAAVYLLLPQIPMLFMGEEWASTRPFQFFCDFSGDLAHAVRDGRRQEFARFAAFHDPTQRARIPDPLAEQTFTDSRLDWDAVSTAPHAATLRHYRALLAVRRRHIVPLLPELLRAGHGDEIASGAVVVRWRSAHGIELTLLANLTPAAIGGFPEPQGRLLWEQGHALDNGALAGWSARWLLRL